MSFSYFFRTHKFSFKCLYLILPTFKRKSIHRSTIVQFFDINDLLKLVAFVFVITKQSLNRNNEAVREKGSECTLFRSHFSSTSALNRILRKTVSN